MLSLHGFEYINLAHVVHLMGLFGSLSFFLKSIYTGDQATPSKMIDGQDDKAQNVIDK